MEGGRNCAIVIRLTLEKRLEDDSSGCRGTVGVVKSDESSEGKWNEDTGVEGRHFLPYVKVEYAIANYATCALFSAFLSRPDMSLWG